MHHRRQLCAMVAINTGIFCELRGLVKRRSLRYSPGMARSRKPLRLLAIVVGLPAAGYLALVLLTPVCGTVVGYADRQPPLRVTHWPGGWAPENAAAIHRLAKLHFDNRPALRSVYWPEPSMIEERADCWIVTFTTKTPIYEWLGYRRALPPSDHGMHFTIDKSDFRTRFGIWCE